MMKWILRQIFERVAKGASTVLRKVFADRTVWQTLQGEPDIIVVFRTSSAERRTVLLGYGGFFEAYFDGDVDIDGERAVGQLIWMAFSGAYRYRTNPLLTAKRTYLEWQNNNQSFARAKANAYVINAIRHYGLTFEFFRLMLGDDCLYAEGYWSEGVTTLAEAQYQRCDYICRTGAQAREPAGGGGFRLGQHGDDAEEYGAEVVNYGLVPEQNRVMQARLEQRGLSGRVRIVERDHRDLIRDRHMTGILSVGVYEHAGFAEQSRWIESIATALKPGGIGMISTVIFGMAQRKEIGSETARKLIRELDLAEARYQV